MKRFLLIPGLVMMLLVGGCIPPLGGEDDELIRDTEENIEETVIIPDVQLKDEYYQTLLPFKKSASRGLVAESRAGTKYDIKEVEEGLLRLSNQHFDPKDFYFQEGQYIDEKTANSWLKRKGEGDNKKGEEDVGLNPKRAPKGTSDADIAVTAPDYLSHIVEQNYLVMTKDKNVKLAGISIGLALKSYYYNVSGREIGAIPDKQIEEQGMVMAEEVVKRLRAQEGLADIPIVIGLFKQNAKSCDCLHGTYFATAFADKGKGLAGWKRIDGRNTSFSRHEQMMKSIVIQTPTLKIKTSD